MMTTTMTTAPSEGLQLYDTAVDRVLLSFVAQVDFLGRATLYFTGSIYLWGGCVGTAFSVFIPGGLTPVLAVPCVGVHGWVGVPFFFRL